jgi:hypothetical protein
VRPGWPGEGRRHGTAGDGVPSCAAHGPHPPLPMAGATAVSRARQAALAPGAAVGKS